MKIFSSSKQQSILSTVLLLLFISSVFYSQGRTKWMAVGSLHNWYSEFGSEIEHGLNASQQWGLRWPASHPWQDMQAAKGLWLGVKNFTDADQFGGSSFLHKVVHVGPRVNGANEFFPVKFTTYGKFENPQVYVDGNLSFQLSQEADEIVPDQPYDKMIYNEVNTMVGATVKRKIYQFSQQYHDNYIIHDITVINTGNVDDDPEIELPNTTLEDLYMYFQYRLAVSYNTRYVIGNATGWGINSMLDVRGDGLGSQYGTEDEDLRANYTWHGKYPPFTEYDNIGAPIWVPNTVNGLLSETDTVGRLGSAQFVGAVTLHADQEVGNPTDDPLQPSTTGFIGSDQSYTSKNDPFNPVKMDEEYNLMSRGHQERHAYVVEPDGNFTEPTADPALSSPGGFTNVNGYGPYTLAPGDSIRIVWAEGASGLSWQQCVDIGRDYKNGIIDAVTKNEHVMTGRDSLFQSFRRAIANFNAGGDFTAPQNPLPPSIFNVDGKGDRIELSWEYDETAGGPAITGFEVFRAREKVDSTYYLVYTASPSDRVFRDTSAFRGVSYYYYIQAVGQVSDNTGGGLTPAGVALRSGRFYSQSYTETQLKRQAAEHVSEFRVVPNPYIRGVASELTFGDDELNKIAFFNIPGDCKIQIFSEMGELIWEVDHNDGSGDEFWYQTTSSNQLVVSGVYIAVVSDNDTGEKSIQKFSIIK